MTTCNADSVNALAKVWPTCVIADYGYAMPAIIDSAGRVVIPKALRERAGLVAGTKVDFRFRDGAIEIFPMVHDVTWEQVGRVRYPIHTRRGSLQGFHP